METTAPHRSVPPNWLAHAIKAGEKVHANTLSQKWSRMKEPEQEFWHLGPMTAMQAESPSAVLIHVVWKARILS